MLGANVVRRTHFLRLEPFGDDPHRVGFLLRYREEPTIYYNSEALRKRRSTAGHYQCDQRAPRKCSAKRIASQQLASNQGCMEPPSRQTEQRFGA